MIRYPHTPQGPKAPKTPHCQERPTPSSRDGSHVTEYLHAQRSPTFEPVAPGGDLMPAQAQNRRGMEAQAPTPRPQFNPPDAACGHPEVADPINWAG